MEFAIHLSECATFGDKTSRVTFVAVRTLDKNASITRTSQREPCPIREVNQCTGEDALSLHSIELNLKGHCTHVPPNRVTKFVYVLVHGTSLAANCRV